MTIDFAAFFAGVTILFAVAACVALTYTILRHQWLPLRIACVIIGILLIALIASIRIN